ncbi:MAG TPA: hypothetical protein VHF89_16245, partial [Solirubrobacteraceae bacterium]|nr:hypothetical protein [Solirubrobacteraceae bacterium]
ALIALPIAATLRETVLYLRRHLVLEPWGEGQLAMVAVGGGRPPPCPECGEQPRAGDVYCRRCGTALGSSLPAA